MSVNSTGNKNGGVGATLSQQAKTAALGAAVGGTAGGVINAIKPANKDEILTHVARFLGNKDGLADFEKDIFEQVDKLKNEKAGDPALGGMLENLQEQLNQKYKSYAEAAKERVESFLKLSKKERKTADSFVNMVKNYVKSTQIKEGIVRCAKLGALAGLITVFTGTVMNIVASKKQAKSQNC